MWALELGASLTTTMGNNSSEEPGQCHGSMASCPPEQGDADASSKALLRGAYEVAMCGQQGTGALRLRWLPLRLLQGPAE